MMKSAYIPVISPLVLTYIEWSVKNLHYEQKKDGMLTGGVGVGGWTTKYCTSKQWSGSVAAQTWLPVPILGMALRHRRLPFKLTKLKQIKKKVPKSRCAKKKTHRRVQSNLKGSELPKLAALSNAWVWFDFHVSDSKRPLRTHFYIITFFCDYL